MTLLEGLVVYMKKKHPEWNAQVINIGYGPFVAFPNEFHDEIMNFQEIWGLGYQTGVKEAQVRASRQYEQNLAQVIREVSVASYNEGHADGQQKGYDEGQCQELTEAIIPSDAYDIEIFSVQPSHEFKTGLQAFIGFKYLVGEQEQFHFVKVQFAAGIPNKKIS
jgi:hypothetical protein